MSTRDDLEAAISSLATEITTNHESIGSSVAADLAHAIRDLADAHRLLSTVNSTTQSGSNQSKVG